MGEWILSLEDCMFFVFDEMFILFLFGVIIYDMGWVMLIKYFFNFFDFFYVMDLYFGMWFLLFFLCDI